MYCHIKWRKEGIFWGEASGERRCVGRRGGGETEVA